MYKIVTLALIICLIYGCASPQKCLDKGELDKAYTLSLKKVQQNKRIAFHQDLLNKALEAIIIQQSTKKQALLYTGTLAAKEESLFINQDLQKQINESQAYTNYAFTSTYKTLQEEAVYLQQSCAEEYFEKGRALLNEFSQSATKQVAQQAHQCLVKASNYGYAEKMEGLNTLVEETYELAELVYYVEVNNRFSPAYQADIDRIFQKIEQLDIPYTRIYYKNKPDSTPIDCTLQLNFSSFDIDYENECTTEFYQRQVEDGKREVVEDSTVTLEPIYKTIEAEVTRLREVKTAESIMQLTILPHSNNCLLQDRRFSSSTCSENTSEDTSGDCDAIEGCPVSSSTDSNCFIGCPSILLDSDGYMINNLIRQHYRKFTRYLKGDQKRKKGRGLWVNRR